MKFIHTFFLIPLISFQLQDDRLRGKYIMQYEEKYISENCIIIFNDSIYKRLLSNGKTIKGKIEYTNFEVILRDKKTNLKMSFLKQEIQNDTIYFGTKGITDKPIDEMEISINAGKLIKTK